MKISILTLFPDIYPAFLNSSIIKRTIQKNLLEVEIIDIRDFSKDKHRHVDDTPYGGGAGMLMQIGPVDDALASIKKDNSYILLTSPKAKPYKQKDARRFSEKEHLIIICGHYEGMDERINTLADERFSIGDYILTGGELPSLVLVDSIARLLKSAINKESLNEESYDNNLLEYPQYTKPENYKGLKVPDILLSGDHKKIAYWRHKMALYETLAYRKDLLENYHFTAEEIKMLKELEKELQERSKNYIKQEEIV